MSLSVLFAYLAPILNGSTILTPAPFFKKRYTRDIMSLFYLLSHKFIVYFTSEIPTVNKRKWKHYFSPIPVCSIKGHTMDICPFLSLFAYFNPSAGKGAIMRLARAAFNGQRRIFATAYHCVVYKLH